jgi:hypothetical protein
MKTAVKSPAPASFQGEPGIFSPKHRPPTHRNTSSAPLFPRNPLFPALRSAPTAVSGPPAKSKFLAAEDSSDEDGKFSLGFRVTFDRSHSPTKLKVTCRVSKVTTDEIECSVDDPSQPKLPL